MTQRKPPTAIQSQQKSKLISVPSSKLLIPKHTLTNHRSFDLRKEKINSQPFSQLQSPTLKMPSKCKLIYLTGKHTRSKSKLSDLLEKKELVISQQTSNDESTMKNCLASQPSDEPFSAWSPSEDEDLSPQTFIKTFEVILQPLKNA